MRKRLIEKLTNKKKGTLGYTLTEMLVVVGIIAIACAIAIPSIISISRALKFAQANNYAKSIFLAAQQNLTELRSDGGLGPVQAAPAGQIPENNGFPAEYKTEYVYTSTGHDAFNLVLPPASIDADVRDDQIIIEYNPLTGNVYAVFYCADELVKGTGESMLALYQAENNALPRDKDSRRDLMVGYYDGSGLNSSQIELEDTQASVEFVNGEEGVIRVLVPMPESFFGEFSQFAGGLEVSLNITGDYSLSTLTQGETVVPLTIDLDETTYEVGVDGKTVIFEFPIDSLASRGSFANYASGTQSSEPGVATTGESLTTLLDETRFTRITQVEGGPKSVYQILPGENITIQANVEYNGTGADVVTIAPGILSGVNPMFEYLQPSGAGGYILAVSNGRNLQNLNAIAPTIAEQVEAVVFTSDIYWNDTVAYYNTNYGSGSTYAGAADEAPCRALPYFVPIHHESLFGTARFIFPGEDDGGMGGFLDDLWEFFDKIGEVIFGGFNNPNVPTLTDEMDAVNKKDYPSIQGGGHKVYNLNIDAMKYAIPNADSDDPAEVGRFYATGAYQIVDHSFTGLFGYVNTPINSLHVVNPIVKGRQFDDKETYIPVYKWEWDRTKREWVEVIDRYDVVYQYSNPATGALLGVGGYNTVITDCSTYIDKDARGYAGLAMGPLAYSATADQRWYGVSGNGAVGGLVGYAKSHRSVNGALTNSKAHISFSDCFAAVPVSGIMRTTAGKDFGYSNGVGGLIGNSQLTNFYRCYASGDVLATGCVVNKTDLGNFSSQILKIFGIEPDLLYNGRSSWGAGGFVGSSHGTCYTNCFATGDVSASSTGSGIGAGGFVGVMSIDETSAYGNDALNSQGQVITGQGQIAQRTVFTNCYAVGAAVTDGTSYESFSGANARIVFDLGESFTYFIGDYYRLYAPYYDRNDGADPVYGKSYYIYRDTYYMNRPDTGVQYNTQTCAEPAGYEVLQNLPAAHSLNSTWAQAQIGRIKGIPTIKFWLFIPDITNYEEAYFDANAPHLENRYLYLYTEGYSDDEWESATTDTTHPYTVSAAGAVYPFSKLVGLDYYGDWPAKPSDMGMAYYEQYVGDKDHTYYVFDKERVIYDEETDVTDVRLTLKKGPDAVVSKDGYAIFSDSQKNLVVTVGNVTETLTWNGETFNIEGESYNAFFLSDTLMDAVRTANEPADEFYRAVTAYHVGSADEYTMYFNPDVAISHVNPMEGSKTAKKPDTPPTTIYVRSARQFKDLATLVHFWDSEFRYIQQLNIDATKYDDWAASTEDNDYKVSSIGTAAQPFQASYTAAYADADTLAELAYKITGFEPTEAGFFGMIGENGSVSDLIVECIGANVGSEDMDSAAIFAGVNNGAIDNVTLTITGPVSLIAATDAGLLAGLSTGSVTDCTVTTDDKSAVTLSAANAGGLIGSVTGTEDQDVRISNTTLNLGAALRVNNSTNAGGYIGRASYLTLEKPTVVVKNVTTDADYAGNLLGYTENTTVTGSTDANIKEITGEALTAEGYAAGVLGGAKNTVLSGVDSSVKSVTGDVAAGFLGTGENADASNCTVLVTEKLEGDTGAAGVAGIIGSQSVFDHVSVTLTGVTVKTVNGNAAGYALEIQGEAAVMNSSVTLGNCGKNTENILVCDQTKHTSISGSSDAAGFACVIFGSVGNSNVTGHGSITSGNHAAGYAITINGTLTGCHVSPAHNDADYLGNANSNLRVSGVNAAGFAMTIGENTEISNIYTLCAISASGTVETEGDTEAVKAAFGFAGTNAGTINRCVANVDITGGYAFVGENNGLVTTSYGWFDDGSKDSYDTITEMSGDGKCFSSYFADLNPVKKSDESVVLYDEKGVAAKVTPSVLQNAEIKGFITDYNAYPYEEMEPADYLYPMLRNHYGNWITPPQYANGYAYYEKYSDGSYKIHLIDLSDASKTEEGAKVIWNDNFNEEGIIEQAGYAQFFNTQTGNHEGTKVTELKIGEYTYVLYVIEDVGQKTYTNTIGASKSVTIDTRYADAMVEDTAFPGDYVYQIRTPGQFANVKFKSAASFIQKRDIETDGFVLIDNFTGRYNGSGKLLTVTDGNAWITTLGSQGSVENVNLTVTGAVTAPIFVTVNGTLELDALNLGSVDQAGALVTNVGGNITSGPVTIGTVSGKVFGTVNTTVRLGAVKIASVSENGALVDLINNADSVVSTGIVRIGTGEGESFKPGMVSGCIFGTVNGRVNTAAITTGEIAAAANNKPAGQIFGSVSNSGTVTADLISTGAVNGKIFADVTGTVELQGSISTGAVIGQVFGDVATATIHGNITTDGKPVSGKIMGNVTGTVKINGTITTGEIIATGQIFGNSTGNITVGTAGNDADVITTGAVSGQVFGNVADTTIHGNITTAGNTVSGKVFGNVNGTVNVNGTITTGEITAAANNKPAGQIFGTVAASKAVTVSGTITTGAVNGQIFGDSNGNITVGTIGNTTDIITTGAVSGQVFGNVANTTIHGNITTAGNTVSGKVFGNVTDTATINGSITTGAVSGQVFGNVANTTIHGDIAVGQVDGKVFGTVTASKTVTVNGAITTGAVSGKIFEGVAGTVNLSSDLVLGDIGADGEVFGDGEQNNISVNTVNVGKITAETVQGKIFADVTGTVTINGTITTGEITAAANNKPAGQIFGNVTAGSVTADAISTETVNGQIFGDVTGTVEIDGTISTAGNTVSGKVFGNVNGTVNVNGTITTGEITAAANNKPAGQIFGTVSGTVNSGAISTGAVSGQIFGNSTGTITVGTIGNKTDIITTGAISGQVFGGVAGITIHGNITTAGNTVSGKVFGNVNGTVNVNGTITTGTVNGKIFEAVTGTVKMTGDLRLGDIGKTGEVFGDGANDATNATNVNNVTVGKIAANAVDGMIFANVTGTVKTGAISIGTGEGDSFKPGVVNGQMFGNVTAGSVTADAITTGAVNGQIFGAVSTNVTVTNGISVGDVSGKIFGTISKGMVQPGAITTGNVSVSNWLITSVSGGTVQLGSVTVVDTDNTVPAMIGAISGGTVSGGTVQLNAANTSGSLFHSVTNGATLRGFTVNTTGSLGASLIGTVSGNATSSAKAKIDDVNVTATGEAASFTGSGLLINTLGNALVEITGCDVQCGQINVGSKTFGGITGTVPAGVKLSNSTVKATLNVTGTANTVIGGLVGVNSGEVSMGQNASNVTINYTQPATNTDSATIGGLIGQMNGGKLTGTSGKVSVTGAINLKSGKGEGRNYVIGGVVGEAGNVTFKDVSASVTVGTTWQKAKDKTSSVAFVDSIVNAGPVGMFVGYADNGTYTNCFSVAANATYQFLGQTEINVVPFQQDVWTSSVSAELLKVYSDLVAEDGSYPAFEPKDAVLTVVKNYTEVSTDLNGCYFYWNGKLQEQEYASDGNFYTRDNGTPQSAFAKDTVVKGVIQKTDNIKIGDSDKNKTLTYTDLYYNYGGTSYGLVTKVVIDNGSTGLFVTNYTATLYYIGSDGKEASVPKTDSVSWFGGKLNIEFNAFTVSSSMTNGSQYMIVSGTSLVGENGATVGADTAFKDRDTTKSNYIFSYADSKLTAATANAIARTVTLVKENHYTTATPEVKFTVEGLTLGEETQFSLYTVAVDPDAYLVYQFTPLKDAIYNRQKLGYDAAPSNLVIPVTLAIEYESDLPAESGEAPEGTEVVETTEATEPAVTE